MQPLWTKKNHATSQGKKYATKNHATSQDIKKSRNLRTNKNFNILKICFKVNLKMSPINSDYILTN